MRQPITDSQVCFAERIIAYPVSALQATKIYFYNYLFVLLPTF